MWVVLQNTMDVPAKSGHGYTSAAFKSHDTRPDTQSSFQRALSPLLVLGQCFALMPVSGLTGRDASTLRFRWLSPRVVYTCLSLIGILCHLYFCMRELITGNRITYAACGKWSSAWILCSIVYKWTNTMEQSSSWEASSCSPSSIISCVLWNPGGSLQCSQKPAAEQYPEPDKSTPHFPI